MSRQLISRATDLFWGAVSYGRAFSGKYGAPISPLYVKHYGAILTADADGVCASQAVTLPAVALINGALASGGVATFDVPRAVVAAWTGAAVLTVTGTDEYGATIIEQSASGTSHTGAKAFKTITGVSVSANVTGLTVGTGDVIGLPFRSDAGDVLLCLLGDSAIDAATFVKAVTTDPATAITGDVRGTFNPSAAINGTNRFSIVMQIHDRSSKNGTYGVDQYDG